MPVRRHRRSLGIREKSSSGLATDHRRGPEAVHPGANFDIGPIQRARADRRKRLRRIRRLADQPPSDERSLLLRRECSAYARSPFVRRAILSSLPQFHRWDHERLKQLVDDLDPQTRCTAEVLYWTEAKPTAGERYLCSLPAQPHVGEMIAKDLVTAQLRPHPSVFDWLGRGRLRYANALARAIEQHGSFVVTMDIKSCHPSVDPDALYRTNLLPTELIRWSVDYRNLSFRCVDVKERFNDHCSVLKPTGPRGLLQGGPASSALLTALIGQSVAEVRRVHCQSYSDNFSIVGDAAAVVQQAAGELTRIVAEYRVGQLEFHSYEVVDARDGFQQLGFDFKLVGTRVRISPNTGNTLKMLKRIEHAVASADDTSLARGPLAFVIEEAAAYRVMPRIDFGDVDDAVDHIWREEVERRRLR